MRCLTSRAKHRLKIAARFMRQKGMRFDSGNFYDSVLAAIESLPSEERERMKELVNWVEEYELAERKSELNE